jgi:hypothetical protein
MAEPFGFWRGAGVLGVLRHEVGYRELAGNLIARKVLLGNVPV